MADKNKKTPTPEERLLKAYRRKCTVQALIKSLVPALIAGFALSIIVSAISFALSCNILWIALVVWAASTAGFTVLFYFKIFKTDMRETASRVDEIGLDERVITMVEFAGRDDVISRKQRQDTETVLQSVNPKQMKFGFTKVFIAFLVILAIVAVTSVFMMSYSTVRANYEDPVAGEQTELTEEDRIIQDMLDSLREIIAEANIKEELRDSLNQMVDDLEASLKPTDSTEVKIAKISETSQLIHKILQDELAKTTIAEELQKYDTTRELGEAIESADAQKIEQAFTDMYNSIAPLVGEEKYDVLIQTANDIWQALEDATETEEALAEALDALAQAFIDAIPENPPVGGEEDRVNDEINKALEDAMQEAMDAIKDALEDMEQQDKSDLESVDQSIQDAMKDAMDSLGNKDSDSDDNDDDKSDDGEEGDEDETISGPAHPSEEGEIIYDSVIDGKTPYMDVYEKYYDWAMELLSSGTLSDEERQIIENYFKLLN